MYLKIIALLDKEVQLVLELLQHGPLQESLSLAKSLQTLSLSEHRVHTVNTHKRTNTKMCVCVWFFFLKTSKVHKMALLGQMFRPLTKQEVPLQETALRVCTLPVMVVLVDDGDGARVQVDPQEVRPHLHTALQLVGVLDPSQLAVDGVDTQGCCCSQRGHHCIVKTVFPVT